MPLGRLYPGEASLDRMEAEWRRAHDALLAKEKAATRARDALAAERRRQPMVRIEKAYIFESAKGDVSLLDLFEGRRQLIERRLLLGSQLLFLLQNFALNLALDRGLENLLMDPSPAIHRGEVVALCRRFPVYA